MRDRQNAVSAIGAGREKTGMLYGSSSVTYLTILGRSFDLDGSGAIGPSPLGDTGVA